MSQKSKLADSICSTIGFKRPRPGASNLSLVEMEMVQNYLTLASDLSKRILKNMEKPKHGSR